MSAIKLLPRAVQKVWGRRDLPSYLGAFSEDSLPIGEIWFEAPSGAAQPLLVKFLFTSEKLSVQVHPDKATAQREGFAGGKDEAWWVLSAEKGATIGIGLNEPVSKAELKAASGDGRVEEMLDWRAAQAEDFYYVPAGTIHALGPGLALIEIQEAIDVTYRLYDYGRDRELHVDQAVAVANPGPYHAPFAHRELTPGRTILSSGGAFVLEQWHAGPGTLPVRVGDAPLWLIPLAAGGTIDGEPLLQGTVWLVEGQAEIMLEDTAGLLVAYQGDAVREDSLPSRA